MQVEESYRDWLKRERAEARAEARDEAAADILLRLLGQRFGDLPPDVVARIRGADRAELERLTDRVLTATTLEDAVR
jgi:hypothetical protein